MAGKGDKPRPVNKNKFDRNYERIFRKFRHEQKINSTNKKPLQTQKSNKKTISK